jgi:uncharacterized RDD family membrane protein YckC
MNSHVDAASADSQPRPAGLAIRVAAMTYDAILLFGVVFVVAYAVVALARWAYPLSTLQRATLQAILFVVLGLYFTYQWSKTGQTLAMKSWHLRLVDRNGRPPRRLTAALRYVLAWHLFLPGVIWFALFGGRTSIDALVSALGVIVLLLPAFFDTQHRLLHDRLSATRIVRER